MSEQTPWHFPETDRPTVRAVFVSSLDGAGHDADGVSGTFGGDVDSEHFARLRGLADVLLVGAGTARAEGYGPVDRPIAVVTGRLDVPDALRVPGQMVVTTADADPDGLIRLRETGMEVLAHGRTTIDWPAVLADLAERGLPRVQCEGGPSLHGTLVEQDFVDELCLTIAPVLAAGRAPRIAVGDRAVERRLRLAHLEQRDDVVLTRWTRRRE